MHILPFTVTLLASFLGTVFLCKRIIPLLLQKKMGQRILEIGPRWHKNKEGTPTMGGVCFIIPTVGTTLLALGFMLREIPSYTVIPLILTLLFALANALIGIFDDLTKFKKKQNQGLTPRQKLFLQVSVAAAYLALLSIHRGLKPTLPLPLGLGSADLGILFYPFAMLLLVGVVNFANLTDGIDGLAICEAAILSAFFAVCASAVLSDAVLLLSAAALGGALGFLIFNFHPARVFMGDTGSLFLGALFAGIAILLNNAALILIGGALYLAEGLSVILQVAYFKLTGGRRLFRMAPLHHHFERKGWSEVRVVSVFSLCSMLCCALAYFAYYGIRS